MIVLHILFSAVKSFMGLFIVVKQFLIASVTQVGLSQAKLKFSFSIKSVSFKSPLIKGVDYKSSPRITQCRNFLPRGVESACRA